LLLRRAVGHSTSGWDSKPAEGLAGLLIWCLLWHVTTPPLSTLLAAGCYRAFLRLISVGGPCALFIIGCHEHLCKHLAVPTHPRHTCYFIAMQFMQTTTTVVALIFVDLELISHVAVHHAVFCTKFASPLVTPRSLVISTLTSFSLCRFIIFILTIHDTSLFMG